jgi:alanyl-tRNA synthetase
MTTRLYYDNSFLYNFVASITLVSRDNGRIALVLDRTAFYPTSGGQVYDTGWIDVDASGNSPKLRVNEVAEDEQSGDVLHYVDSAPDLAPATRVRGFIDVERRRDHMRQHSGQHVLSAAFERLFNVPTVSFHMGEETCTIDLEAKSITTEQIREAERLANDIVLEDRPVSMQFVTPDEGRALGLRKIPPAERDKLRLIDIRDFDLCACGGTHVRTTGQIGAILVRKMEKVRQGVRVEFVCGERAVKHARRDFETLTEAAGALSAHIWDLPQQVRKSLEEIKAVQKAHARTLEELATLEAERIVAATPDRNGVKLVTQVFADRDLPSVKLLAQKITKHPSVVALLGSTQPPAAIVFAQSPGGARDMGALMKRAMTECGGRGGGNRDIAQGGVPDPAKVQSLIDLLARVL